MSGCRIGGAELARLATGALGEREAAALDAHARGCASCTRRLRSLGAGLDALRTLEPRPTTELDRRRAVLGALAAVPARARSRWAIPSLALGAVAACLALWLALPHRPGAAVVAVEDGVTFAPEPDARYAVRDRVVSLAQGTLAFDVRPRGGRAPLTIETAEAVIHVSGAAFKVAASVHRTTLAVQDGVIEIIWRADGTTRRLGAGEALTIDAAAGDLAAPPRVAAAPPPDAPAAPVIVDELPAPAPPRIAEIRSRIRAGQLPAARALIARAKSAGGRVDAAELAIVEAELRLAEGRYGAAVEAYLKVTRRFPRAPQAEAALFAAAQLALDHREAGHDGKALLQRYLAAHPRGRFQEQAARLLRRLEGPRR